jgi:hypothetical protein
MPYDFIPIPGKDPYRPLQDELAEFFIRRSELEKIEECGPKQKYFDARLIPNALLNPDAIFAGLKRDGYQGGYCYCHAPSHWFFEAETGPIEAPVPAGRVFLVFIRPDWGLVVFDWEWREEDEKQPGFPKFWEFMSVLWPTDSLIT